MIHLLTITFIILKVLGYIAWSWWLVLLPSYIALAIVFGSLIFTSLIAGTALFGALAIDKAKTRSRSQRP